MLKRLLRAIESKGLGTLVADRLRTAWELVYCNIELVVVELDLPTWEPHLARFGRGVDVHEVTIEETRDPDSLLNQKQRRDLPRKMRSGSRFFLAEKGGKAASMVGVNQRYDDRRWGVTYDFGDGTTIMHRVTVFEGFRRSAVGGVLVEAAFQLLKDEGLDTVYGVISSANVSSLRLAQNLRFHQGRRVRKYRLLYFISSKMRIVENEREKFAPPAKVRLRR